MNELSTIKQEYNLYPAVINYPEINPYLRSPHAIVDLLFYQTIDTVQDIDSFRNFLRNIESSFRSSREYKAYKAYLIEYIGINRCQIFGNITVDDAPIEMHHSILNLFDIALMITLHTINTVGMVTSFDVIQMLIFEHWNNRVSITFLSETAHQIYHNDPDGFIPPDMCFGCWWELIDRYKYGITYDIAKKIVNYIKKYQDKLPVSINIQQQEQIFNYAYYNETGCMPPSQCGSIPLDNFGGDYSDYGF